MRDRDEYLYYIHGWHKKLSPRDVVIPIDQMEKYIMSTFAAKIESLKDPADPSIRPFHHDFMETDGEEKLVKFASVRSFMSRTRLSLRRVFGCGHLVLSIIYMAYNKLERSHGESWPDYALWRTMKADVQERDLLNPASPCNSEAVYEWFQVLYNELAKRLADCEAWDSAQIPFTMLQLKPPTDRNMNEDSDDFMTNYQEFLAFILHNMHELGLLAGEPQLTQYHMLMRRREAPPPESMPRSQAGFLRVVKTTVTKKAIAKYSHPVKMNIRQFVITAGAGETQRAISQSVNYSGKSLGTTTKHGNGRWSSTWQSIGRVSQWQKINRGAWAKILSAEWRLGCAGCPTGVQKRVTKSGRKRECKWVTTRRLVLVKRVVTVRRQRATRTQPAVKK